MDVHVNTCQYQIIRYLSQGACRESTFLGYPCYGRTVDWQCTLDDHLLILNTHGVGSTYYIIHIYFGGKQTECL